MDSSSASPTFSSAASDVSLTLSELDLDPSPKRAPPFDFFKLPYELRHHILTYLLTFPRTVDLDPANHKHLTPILFPLLFTSRQLSLEARIAFYSHNAFRIFTTTGRFFHTKWPLLSRFPRRNRRLLRTLELRLGPGWTRPPKSWDVANKRLRLNDCTDRVWRLVVFLECDPSDAIFTGFRKADGFYSAFCTRLLRDVLATLNNVREVRFEGWPSVRKASSPLLQQLEKVVEEEEHGQRAMGSIKTSWDESLLRPPEPEVDPASLARRQGGAYTGTTALITAA